MNNKLINNNTISSAISNHRSTLFQQNIFRQQNSLACTHSPAAASGLSPLTQQSLVMNSNTNNSGGTNQTLLVCSPASLNDVTGNNQNNMIRPITTSNTYTKCSTLHSSNSPHLLAPVNLETKYLSISNLFTI